MFVNFVDTSGKTVYLVPEAVEYVCFEKAEETSIGLQGKEFRVKHPIAEVIKKFEDYSQDGLDLGIELD